jgi:hypothetical protein
MVYQDGALLKRITNFWQAYTLEESLCVGRPPHLP